MSDDRNHTQLTAEIVAAYIENNDVRIQDLPDLIRSVHQTLSAVGARAKEPIPRIKTTAGQVRRSITPDALISFEDGKPYKQLKRHLTALGMTPNDYRAKWDLPPDYPMVAASYSATRSALARTSGLGKKTQTTPVPEPAPAPQIEKTKVRIKGKLGLFGRRSGAT